MMICQFLVGFTDVWVAGHIDRDVQAALGLVIQCQLVLAIVGVAMANGSIAAISQSVGARLPLRAKRYGGMVLKYGLVFAALVTGAAFFLRGWVLQLLQVPETIFSLTEYLWLLFLAAVPSNYLLLLTSAMFRARSMVFIPLGAAAVACLVNVLLATGLGLGLWGFPHLGVEGMAVSTFCSVTAAGLFNIYKAIRLGIIDRQAFGPWSWEKKALVYLFKVAAPAGGSQIFWQLGYLVLFGVTASLPHDPVNALAGMNAGMRVESILFLPAIAFSMTASMLVGQLLGAGDKKEAARVAWRIIVTGCLAMSLGALCLWPFAEGIAAFIAPDPQARLHALSYLRYNLLGTPFSVISMILSGILTGAGATVYSLAVFSSAVWLVRLPLAYLFGHIIWQDATGVFFAMFVSQAVQASLILFVFRRCDWARFAMTARRAKKNAARHDNGDR